MSGPPEEGLPLRLDGRPYAFMVVDDSDFMIKNLRRIIAGLGGDVVATASDGAEAVAAYRALTPKPDLVTMDITMPVLDGLAAARAILGDNARQRIVMVSSMGQKETVREALLIGAKHFVVKPFQPDDLRRVFRFVLLGEGLS